MARPNFAPRSTSPSGTVGRTGSARAAVEWLRGFTLDALVVWGSVWLCVPPPPRAERALTLPGSSPDSSDPNRPATAPLSYDERRWQAELTGN